DGEGLICLGLAGSLASAGLGPLNAWVIERGYVGVVGAPSPHISEGQRREDLLEPRVARFFQVDPEHVDDSALWAQGFYRFYDHVVSADVYDETEYFMGEFFTALAKDWTRPAITGARFVHEFGRWLGAARRRRHTAATRF